MPARICVFPIPAVGTTLVLQFCREPALAKQFSVFYLWDLSRSLRHLGQMAFCFMLSLCVWPFRNASSSRKALSNRLTYQINCSSMQIGGNSHFTWSNIILKLKFIHSIRSMIRSDRRFKIQSDIQIRHLSNDSNISKLSLSASSSFLSCFCYVLSLSAWLSVCFIIVCLTFCLVLSLFVWLSACCHICLSDFLLVVIFVCLTFCLL